MKSVLKEDGDDGCTTIWMYLTATLHLKMVKMVNFMLCIFYHNFFKKTYEFVYVAQDSKSYLIYLLIIYPLLISKNIVETF